MKKILIIFVLISFSISQILALTNWSQLSLNYFKTNVKHGIDIITGASQDADHINKKGKFGVQYQHEISGKITDKFYFDVKEDIFFSEKSHEQRNSFLINELKAKIFYQHNDTYLKMQFNNRYYESRETNYLNLPGIEYDTQQRMVHNAILHLKQDFGKLNLNLYTSFRDLEYNYAVPEEDDDYKGKSGSDFDVYSLGKITYSMTDYFRMFSRVYYKNDFNDSSELNEINLGGGFEYENRIDFFNSVFARVSYYNLDSEGIDDVFTHNILTEARYTKRFAIPLTGFISYINHSVYDEEISQLLRVSNMVRIHLKHSYLLENTLDSFILAGVKYNPENSGNLIFGELNQFLFDKFYLSAGGKLVPELYSQYVGKLEFYITPIKSIWLKTEFTDFENKFSQNIISLGSTLIF